MSISYCSLASGSSGNCHFIGTENAKILIDAGLSAKYISTSLEKIGENISAVKGIFVTHEHGDHVKGIPVIMRKYGIPLYVNRETLDKFEAKLTKIDLDLIHVIENDQVIEIGDLEIHPFDSYHDVVRPFGYNVFYKNKKVSVLTDVGLIDEPMLKRLEDSDFLVLESNHDVNMVNFGPYPYPLKQRILGNEGHLSNERAGEVIAHLHKSGRLKNVVLAHLSKDNNFPELAFLTVKNILEDNEIIIGEDINVDLTYRDRIGKYYRIV